MTKEVLPLPMDHDGEWQDTVLKHLASSSKMRAWDWHFYSLWLWERLSVIMESGLSSTWN